MEITLDNGCATISAAELRQLADEVDAGTAKVFFEHLSIVPMDYSHTTGKYSYQGKTTLMVLRDTIVDLKTN